jgi:hypothetical protein
MYEERNNIPLEKLHLMVIRAENYKSKPDVKSIYDILDTDLGKPEQYNQSILRYIPGDHNDSFDIILN